MMFLLLHVGRKRYGFWLSSITFVDKEEFNGYVIEEIQETKNVTYPLISYYT